MKEASNSLFIPAFSLLFLIFCPMKLFAAGQLDEIKRLQEREREQQQAIIRPAVSYQGRNYKDPFRSRQQADPSQQNLAGMPALPPMTIQGIVWGSDIPQAIVNNQVVRVGNALGSVHIISIKKEGIKVIFQGQEYFLPAPASGILPPVENDAEKDTTQIKNDHEEGGSYEP